MNSKYKSGKSVAKNPTIPISVDDPRVAWNKVSQTKSRQGSEIDIVGFDGKSLVAGGTNTSNLTGISGSVNPSGTKQLQYVPAQNGNPGYNMDPGAIIPTDVTNVVATWSLSSPEDLVINFDWEYDNAVNTTITEFVLEVTADGVTRQTPAGSFIPNRTQTAQTLTLTKSLNRSTLGIFRTSITSVCVYAIDSFYNKSNSVCDNTIPAYVLNLPVPVITVTAATSGYNVAYTIPTESIFDAIDIVEYESNASTEPTGVTYSRVYFDSISPANVITLNTNPRWVKARFSSDSGVYTAFSAAQKITPLSPVTVDTEGPANVATVTTTGGLDTTGTIGFNGYADISWASVTTGGIRGYRIRYRPVTNPVSSYSYADSPGAGTAYRLSGLGTGLTYEIAVATYDEYNNTSTSYVAGSNVTISGTPFIGTNVSTTGFFQAGVSGTDTGTFKFGYGVDTGKRGLVFNAHNYWYIDSAQSASLKVGGSTTNYIEWNGSTFTIDGDVTARGGYFAGNVGIISGGSLYSGTISGGALSGAGYVLNSTGLKFNSSTTNDITTINGSTGLFTTASANIGGWSVNATEISKTQTGQGKISLNSAQGYISISNDGIANQTAGINSPTLATDNIFWSGGTGPTDETSPFRVRLNGDIFASNATIKGIIRATDGGFGSFSGSTITKGWQINASGITGVGLAEINLTNSGQIILGGTNTSTGVSSSYSIRTLDGSDFSIYDNTDNSPVLRTDSVVNAGEDPKRIFLGNANRHVEVARSASLISGSSGGTRTALPTSSPVALSAYRSGGLRNMFTVEENYLGVDSSTGNITSYPSALKGDVLIVYDANLPDSSNPSEYPWRKIVAMYLNTRGASALGPFNTVAPIAGALGNRQYSTTTGTWSTNGVTPTYTYQWRSQGAGVLFSDIPTSKTTNGNSTSSTISLNDDTFDGLDIKCFVTATVSGEVGFAYSNAVTVSAAGVSSTTTTTAAPGTTTTTTTAAPSNFAISAISSTHDSITYSWANAPAGTVLYSIFYVEGDTPSTVTTTTSTSHTFSGLSSGTTYSVYVSARSSSNATLASDNELITTVGRPVNSFAPFLTNSGTTITSTAGTWSENPTSYTYRWYRDDIAPQSAGNPLKTETKSDTTATYVGSSSANYDVYTTVTATNLAGTSSPVSSANSISLYIPAGSTTTTTTAAPATTTTTAAPATTTTTAAPGDPRCPDPGFPYYYYSSTCTASDDANGVSYCGEDGITNLCAGGSGPECPRGCGGPPGGYIV